MSSCPGCQKPVDPVRARYVRVVDSAVVAYCSVECYDGAARQVAVAAPPGAPAAVEFGKVAKKAADRVDGNGGASTAPPVVEAKPSEKPLDGKDGKKAATSAEAKGERTPSVAAAKGAKASDASVERAPAVSDAGGPAKSEAKSDAKNDAKNDAKGGKPDAKSEAKPEPKSAAKPEAKSVAKAESKPAKPEGKGATQAAKPAADAAIKPEATNDSAAKNGKGAKPGPSSQTKSQGNPPAEERKATTAAQPEPVAALAVDEPVAPSSGARWGRWLAAAAVLAALSGAAWWALRPQAAPPPAPPPAPVTPPSPPPPPVYTPAEAQARAIDVLRGHLTIESLRVRRVAAAALARLGDAQAIDTLAALLPTEQSALAKLDIGYGLARAKDPRGYDILVAGLRANERDVKGDAARLLAALRDDRATTTLSSLANLTQFSLAATEQLARLGNNAAIARLDKIRVDPQRSQEERWRAVIALGDARQPHVVEELRALLGDLSFNVRAAGALAVLRDESCRPTLLTLLATSTLRVEAALALRRLDPDLRASEVLPVLMPVLESAKDMERVEAAEAILVLTGPASLAEVD